MTDTASEALFDLAVVVCTFNRRDHVVRTLCSAIADLRTTRPDLRVEAVIADNGPQRYGPEVAEAVQAAFEDIPESALSIAAIRSSPPNISIARNGGIAATSAPLVAFLDDDLIVESGWGQGLITALDSQGADAVIGPVRPVFAAGAAPDWDPEAKAFTRVLEAEDGSRIHVGGPNRTPNFTVSTASSLWRRDRCFTDAAPFDPRFGVCGGEDYDLFLRLENRGCRIHWAARGGVRETVPDTRITLGYRFLRGFSGGQVYAAITAKNAPSPRRTLAAILARAAVQSVARAVLLPIALLIGPKPRRWEAMVNLGLAVGKLAWWRTIPLYHMEKTDPKTETGPQA